jgi:hypothetical protein
MLAYSLGDLADRFTINVRKRRILENPSLDEEISELRKSIMDILKHKKGITEKFLQDLVELSDLNNGIWEMEFKLRLGKNEEKDLAILGSRAIKIRDLNMQRVAVKNKMNQYSHTGFKDIKVNHCSEV